MSSMRLRCGKTCVEFSGSTRPLVMGIVNVNDDSFSGDGSLDAENLREQARKLISDGADILDIGAESARTNRAPISVEEEVRRFSLFEGIRKSLWEEIEKPPLISLNVWRSETIRRLDFVHADLINDMSGLPDAANARLAAERGAALLIMHTRGEPKQKHTHVSYDDVVADAVDFFERKIRLACESGLDRESLVLDPGFDFAKQKEDNVKLLAGLGSLQVFGRPLLLPVSRKSFIGQVTGVTEARDRDPGTIAAAIAGAIRGGSIVRAHHVGAVVSALDIWKAVEARR